MKKLLLIFSALFVFASAQIVVAGPVNDTGTKLQSWGTGDDPTQCMMIKPVYGYLTMFGDHGGAGKAIVVGLAIANLGFQKEVWVGIKNLWEPAHFGSGPNGAGPSISYLKSAGNIDFFEVTDFRVGPENSAALSVSVKLNGKIYNCPGIIIGR